MGDDENEDEDEEEEDEEGLEVLTIDNLNHRSWMLNNMCN